MQKELVDLHLMLHKVHYESAAILRRLREVSACSKPHKTEEHPSLKSCALHPDHTTRNRQRTSSYRRTYPHAEVDDL